MAQLFQQEIKVFRLRSLALYFGDVLAYGSKSSNEHGSGMTLPRLCDLDQVLERTEWVGVAKVGRQEKTRRKIPLNFLTKGWSQYTIQSETESVFKLPHV